MMFELYLQNDVTFHLKFRHKVLLLILDDDCDSCYEEVVVFNMVQHFLNMQCLCEFFIAVQSFQDLRFNGLCFLVISQTLNGILQVSQ